MIYTERLPCRFRQGRRFFLKDVDMSSPQVYNYSVINYSVIISEVN